jgi:hypothetical protein
LKKRIALGVEASLPIQSKAPHRLSQPADRQQQQSGDLPKVAALAPKPYGRLQLQRVERPPLDAANTPSIRRCYWPT